MLAKYLELKRDVIEFINNNIELGVSRKKTVAKLLEKYPVYIAFFNVDNEMMAECFEWIYDGMYFKIKNEHYTKED